MSFDSIRQVVATRIRRGILANSQDFKWATVADEGCQPVEADDPWLCSRVRARDCGEYQ